MIQSKCLHVRHSLRSRILFALLVNLIAGWTQIGYADDVLRKQSGDHARPKAANFETIHSKGGIQVKENGKPILFYQMAPKQLEGPTSYRRSHYVHPVYDLSGTVITEDFPKDHKHHRGIFWAWHQVLVDSRKAGDAWLCKDFNWEVTDATATVKSNSVQLSGTAFWTSENIKDDAGKRQRIAKDEVLIHIHPRTADSRAIDFTIRLTALLPNVRIGGSDDEKGYGGFSPRIRMPADLTFASSTGPVKPTKLAVESDRWMLFQADEFSYVIFNHRSNADPNKWILRQKRSMQNPVYPGQQPVELKMDTPTVLRHRIVILQGRGQAQYDLPAMLKAYDDSDLPETKNVVD